MNILFIKPKYKFDSYHPVQYTNAEKPLPLSLAYLSAVAEKAKHKVKVIDYQIREYSIENVLNDFKPDLVGITLYSKEYEYASHLISSLKNYKSDLAIVAGGPHINAYKEKLLEENKLIDFLVVHEGELVFLNLLNTINNGDNYSLVKGLIYRDETGNIVINEKQDFIQDIDSLPFMALHYFEVDKYYPPAGTFRKLPSILMITSRGCPYQCTFCNTDLFGKTIRLRSAENVLEEIDTAIKKYGAKEINFVDETFTINRARVIKICEGLIKNRNKIGWKCSTRVDCVDKKLLKIMKESGCFYIGFGVESGSEKMLKKLKKGISTDQIRTAFKEAKEAGILRAAYIMMNIPGETKEDLEKSIKFSREIAPDFLNFEMIKPYCGTEIRHDIENNSNIKINYELWENWSEYSAGNHLFYTQDGITKEYLISAYDKAVKQFYLRPLYILKMFFKIRTFQQLKSYSRAFLNVLKIKLVYEPVAKITKIT